MQIVKPLVVHIPDTRGVVVSPFGLGNLKIGPGVYTYSRLPGSPDRSALGSSNQYLLRGTCPGATEECQRICYAARPVAEAGVVYDMWAKNSLDAEVPEIPRDAKLLRLHISGDFDTREYVYWWFRRLVERPDVVCWAYTRSWRVPELLPALESLRQLPNMQLFASMDKSTLEMPPEGWRRAWIDGDPRAGEVVRFASHSPEAFALGEIDPNYLERTVDDTKSLVCPEETGAVKNCVECGFCWKGQRNDVTFLQH